MPWHNSQSKSATTPATAFPTILSRLLEKYDRDVANRVQHRTKVTINH